ncbi:MAG: hypothetical protein EXR99_00150 [Gemmataceae bacterium]|nr:hypothetical protein [Gemmataceae bacterium]
MAVSTRFINVIWFLLCLGGSSYWCLSTASQWGPTFDEPTYIECGLQCWRTGSHKPLMRLGTMPLPVDIQTFPLWIAEVYRGNPFDTKDELELILPWARGMNLVFWWMLLFFGWKLGKQFGQDWGARLAVFFLATEPNLTSHAALATTDISLTACILGFVYFYLAGQGKGWRERVGLPALWFALALAAKASALPFVPLIMIGCELWRKWESRSSEKAREGQGSKANLVNWLKPFIKDSFQIGFLGLTLLFLFCGSDWQTERTFVEWARQLPESDIKPWMVWISENLKIFTNAGEGIAQQIKHNIRGHGSYILGQESQRAIWYYFPVLLSIKAGTVVLALAVAFLVFGRKYLPRPLVPAIALLFLFSFNCRVQIGIRFLFPLMALMVLAMGIALGNWQASLSRGKTAKNLSLALVLFLAVGEWLFSWPHGLSFINAYWGGTNSGYKLVCDSNYDWGQGLKELHRWKLQQQGGLAVCYYGKDPFLHQGWARVLPIQELARHQPGEYAGFGNDTLAISATLVYGPTLVPGHQQWKSLMQKTPPDFRVGPFLLYQASSLQKKGRADGTKER